MQALAYADPTCNTHPHADYSGDMAVVWGSQFLVKDAGECCAACRAHAEICGKPEGHDKPFHPQAPHTCGHEYEKACNMCALPAQCGGRSDRSLRRSWQVGVLRGGWARDRQPVLQL